MVSQTLKHPLKNFIKKEHQSSRFFLDCMLLPNPVGVSITVWMHQPLFAPDQREYQLQSLLADGIFKHSDAKIIK